MIEHHDIPTFSDNRGILSSLEFQDFPFQPKRIFYIYGSPKDVVRAEHSHKKTRIALVCLSGSYEVTCKKGEEEAVIHLENPQKWLEIRPGTWHSLKCTKEGSILLVLASESFDPEDFE